jgi:hypothetical protein
MRLRLVRPALAGRSTFHCGCSAAHSLAEIKSRLRIINSTRQINDMIQTRMERENAIVG